MKMGDDEFRSLVQGEIDLCKHFMESEIARKRSLAYEYYIGKPYGNEVEGRSKVVSQDVQQTIDSAVPAIIKTFVASDRAVEFTPRGAEDVEAAEQATDLANYVFYTQNSGFNLVHDCVKDGLLQITGMFKWYWEPEVQSVKETYTVDEQQLAMLAGDPQVEIQAHSAMPMQGPDGQVITVHMVEVRRKKQGGKVRICVVPPEEQLISPRARSTDVYEAPFIGHSTRKPKSELIEMGYTEADFEGVSPSAAQDYSEENESRKDRNLNLVDVDSTPDPAMTLYDYEECYLRADRDGDGIAELRRVCLIGGEIRHDEETDHIPMAYWTPKIMPHEPVGQSMAEEIMDLQLEKSMLRRQANDNLYLANAPRLAVTDGVNIDDVLNNVPGGVIRMGMNGAVTPIAVPFVAQHAFSMIEYIDGEIEARTGVSRLFQGIDPNSLNKTATGVNALMNAAQARLDLISRNFAECALKPMFRGVMYLLGKYQDSSLTIRLKNKFVPIDPRVWTTEYDMAINVGLGTGTRDQQLIQLQSLGMALQMIGQTPFAQQLIDAKKIYNYTEKLAELSGFKDVEIFVNDPDKTPPPEPQPSPEEKKAQAQIAADKEKFSAEQEMEGQKMQQEAALEQQKMAQENQQAMMQAQIDASLEKFKAELKAQTDLQIAQMREAMFHEREMTNPMRYAIGAEDSQR